MGYIFRKIDQTYIVWVKEANRFIQLNEPAFRVFNDWDHKVAVDEIIRNCMSEYGLKIRKAGKFVREIAAQLQALVSDYTKDDGPQLLPGIFALPNGGFSVRNYSVNGKNFLFRYYRPDIESLFHPGFSYLERPLTVPTAADHCLDLFYSGDRLILQVDGLKTWGVPLSTPELLMGLVHLQWLNCIHGIKDDFWMGSVHASAVLVGDRAIVFTAPSGSGKSTLAALLMNRGHKVLTDDLAPVSLNNPMIYPFPDGLSVKKRSLPILSPLFPGLEKADEMLSAGAREVFLPISTGVLLAPAPVSAIVFVHYDTTVECKLEKISNLSAIDSLLQQLWLRPEPEVAERFLDWFLTLPCYRLTYSDNTRMVGAIERLFMKGEGIEGE